MRYTSEHFVGSFNSSNCMIITDPCYNYDPGQIIEDMTPGKWNAEILVSEEGSWGDRVAELRIVHEDHDVSDYDYDCVSKFEVGVDSGQAGFFDSFMYPRGTTGEYGDLYTFYGKACEMTISEEKAGVFPFGVVSRTGFGDGGYSLWTVKQNGKVIAAKIVFISDNDYEDEEYDEEE